MGQLVIHLRQPCHQPRGNTPQARSAWVWLRCQKAALRRLDQTVADFVAAGWTVQRSPTYVWDLHHFYARLIKEQADGTAQEVEDQEAD